MLRESLEYLHLRPEGVYVDATFGGGGHSKEILNKLGGKGRLYAFDQDVAAQQNARQEPFAGDDRFRFIRSNFRHLKRYLRAEELRSGSVDGILADLGVSSHQLDTPERGFSYRFEAPLDMRMNTEEGPTAADVLNTYTADELQRVFGTLGEVRNARTLAKACTEARQHRPFRQTGDLLAVSDPLVIGENWRYRSQVFQALRMEVNEELPALAEFLQDSLAMLATGGILVVLAYHSIEDRMVKNFLKTGDPDGEIQQDFYGKIDRPFEILTKKPLEPSDAEIQNNARARSAKLRAGKKIHLQNPS